MYQNLATAPFNSRVMYHFLEPIPHVPWNLEHVGCGSTPLAFYFPGTLILQGVKALLETKSDIRPIVSGVVGTVDTIVLRSTSKGVHFGVVFTHISHISYLLVVSAVQGLDPALHSSLHDIFKTHQSK